MTVALIAVSVAIFGATVLAIMFGVAWIYFAEVAERNEEDSQ